MGSRYDVCEVEKLGRASATNTPRPVAPTLQRSVWYMGKTIRTVRVVKTTTTIRTVRTVTTGRRPQGVILYRGPSLLDGSPIVCVATGLCRRSKNPKTGKAVQTWVLADDGENPVQAWQSGGDASVCGDCPHRGATCYVNVVQA